ncbi:uncharacterized protein C8Q71DRAFT_757691 [Rhodofomes roseus]|uniref:Homeobox domain-containing protein n=1 Tax=Rhodofomes roseus TaxID=34475 RepID=A0ABQ8KHK0_9APHY|nr:uncharacterized protein C8Q71DRAFT_757691 [Rhodofomes roseus]KAH9837317.1 hypothetical protein C8Q71DRAFT_757691 [Rhodofomes roseus]
MARTTAHNAPSAPRKRAQASKVASEAPAEEKKIGRPSSSGTRKRVNIDSLAARLGPEVVKELEALIIPGSKEMPSFTARQAVQKQFNVNRRHIYDWYHTKGLRVAREETRAEEFTPARPQRESRRRAGETSTPDMTFDASEDGDSSFSSPNLLLTPAQHGAGPAGAYGDYAPFASAGEGTLNTWYYYYGPPASGRPEFQTKQPYVTSTSTTPIIPATVKTPSQGGLGSSGSGQTLEAAESIQYAGRSAAHEEDENVEPGLPPDLSGLLSGSERQALYDSLSGILGPPNGFEESVGTYKAYMQRQSQIYYESLLPSPAPSSLVGNYASATANPSILRASQTGLGIGSLAQQNVPGSIVPAPYTMQPLVLPLAAHGTSQYQQDETWKPSGGSTPANSSTGPPSLGYPETPSSASVTQSSFGTPHGFAHAGTALELGDILESPLLRSRNPSSVGHALYAVNPVQAHPWYPAHAYVEMVGHQAANPVYHPAMPARVPTWQPAYMPPVPTVSAASTSGGQWERGHFMAMLQDAIPAPAESPAMNQEMNKNKKQDSAGQHTSRTRTESRGM